jgi:hypothetical protein
LTDLTQQLDLIESIQTNLIVFVKSTDHVMAPEDGTYWGKRTSSYAQQRYGEGFPDCNLEVDFCEHCIYGKQNHVRFPSGATREKGILELIHSDVFGPVPVPSLGGSLYYVSFIDDFSRKTWLYFLRKKYEVFE